LNFIDSDLESKKYLEKIKNKITHLIILIIFPTQKEVLEILIYFLNAQNKHFAK